MSRRREVTDWDRHVAWQRRSQYLSARLWADCILEATYRLWVQYDHASTSTGESRVYFRMLAAEVRRRMARELERQAR